MRFYIISIIVSVIAIAVNASIIEKRELSAGFEDCSKNLTAITDRLVHMKKVLSNARVYMPIRYMVLHVLPEPAMKKLLSSAEEMCCGNFAPSMNDEDSNEIFAFLPPLAENYDSVATDYVNKKDIISKSSSTLKGVKATLPLFDDSLNKLFNCLTLKSPANRTPAKTDLLDKFNKASSAAKAAYGF